MQLNRDQQYHTVWGLIGDGLRAEHRELCIPHEHPSVNKAPSAPDSSMMDRRMASDRQPLHEWSAVICKYHVCMHVFPKLHPLTSHFAMTEQLACANHHFVCTSNQIPYPGS